MNIHERLMARGGLYAKWHTENRASGLHFLILFTVAVIAAAALIANIPQEDGSSLSAASIAARDKAASAPLVAPQLIRDTSEVASTTADGEFKKDKAMKRSRFVMIDQKALEEQILPKQYNKADDRGKRSERLGGAVSLRLFDDAIVTLKRKNAENAFDGGVVWVAEGTDEGDVRGILVANDGFVTGSIDVGQRNFQIEPVGKGQLHRIREVDQDALPKDEHLAEEMAEGQMDTAIVSATTPTIASETAPAEATIMYAYTKRANDIFAGRVADRAALDVANTNQAFVNSNIPMKFTLVGVVAVDPAYDEMVSTDNADPLRQITTGTTYNFPAIRTQRDTLAADFVQIYADRPEWCGVGWISLSASYAYSAVKPVCSGGQTPAHELGHNMSLYHDRYVESPTDASVYNYGYVSLEGKFRDIMSYNNLCSANGVSCTRINYYSTPLKTYNGYPVGIPQGTAGAADGARRITENISRFVAYRGGSTTSTCTVAAPSVTISPTTQTSAAGSALSYTVSVKNNDSSGCAQKSFALTANGLPADWSKSFSNTSLALNPGASASSVFTATSPTSASASTNTFTVTAADATVPVHTNSASAAYVVGTGGNTGTTTPPTNDTTPPKVTISSPKNGTALKGNGKVNVNVSATDASGIKMMTIAVNGATVQTCNNVTTCTYSWDGKTIPGGTHTITATAIDASTNANTANATATVTK